ncbi:MAG: type II secretion system F family protein [Pseudomonadota bacterium]
MMDFLAQFVQLPLWLVYLIASFLFGALLASVIIIRGRAFLTRYRETFTESAGSNLGDMFVFVNPQNLFMYNLIALVVLPALAWLLTFHVLATIVTFIIVLFVPSLLYKAAKKQRLRRIETQLPDGLLMMSGSMKAGASLAIAMEGTVKEAQPPLSQEFELFIREQRLGVDFEQSLSSLESRIPLPDFGIFIAALRINREIGGNLAETLETLAETFRRKITMEGKIESLTAQGRLQGIVMSCLPLFLIGALMFVEPEATGKLFTTKIGWIWLGVISVMEVLGFLVIRKVTTIDV